MMIRATRLRAGAAGALMMTTTALAQPVLDFGQAAWTAPTGWPVNPPGAFGHSLLSLPDVNADGVTDLAVSIGIGSGEPSVLIFSGATGEPLLAIDRVQANSIVQTAALLRDRRDEERHTLVIAEISRVSDGAPTTLVFVDPENGTVQDTIPMPFPEGLPGVARAVMPIQIGDSDGDGVDDFVAVSIGALDPVSNQPLIAMTALSGASGALLWRRIYPNERVGLRSPNGLALMNDQTGDGRRDLAFARIDPDADIGPVAIEILDVTDGSTVRSLDPPADALRGFGVAMAQTSTGLLAVGDVSIPSVGRVTLHDITTGAVVQTIRQPVSFGMNFGINIIAGEDFSGDGQPDLVIGAPGTDNRGGGIGAVAYVLDEADLSFHWGVVGGLTPSDLDLGSHMASVLGRGDLPSLAVSGPGVQLTGWPIRDPGIVNLYDPPGPCFADLTGDGVIDGADLGVLLGQWGYDPNPYDSSERPANFNSDARVSGADLNYLIASWGICPD